MYGNGNRLRQIVSNASNDR